MSVPAPVPRWIVPVAEILTVGIPFCVFKLLTGLIAVRSPSLAPAGYALLALGSVDALLNVANLVALLVTRKRLGAVCVSEVLLRRLGDSELGLAVDVFISFGLVAIVIGFGLLLRVPAWALPIWNLAVVLNVLGAGVGRLFAALRRVGSAPA